MTANRLFAKTIACSAILLSLSTTVRAETGQSAAQPAQPLPASAAHGISGDGAGVSGNHASGMSREDRIQQTRAELAASIEEGKKRINKHYHAIAELQGSLPLARQRQLDDSFNLGAAAVFDFYVLKYLWNNRVAAKAIRKAATGAEVTASGSFATVPSPASFNPARVKIELKINGQWVPREFTYNEAMAYLTGMSPESKLEWLFRVEPYFRRALPAAGVGAGAYGGGYFAFHSGQLGWWRHQINQALNDITEESKQVARAEARLERLDREEDILNFTPTHEEKRDNLQKVARAQLADFDNKLADAKIEVLMAERRRDNLEEEIKGNSWPQVVDFGWDVLKLGGYLTARRFVLGAGAARLKPIAAGIERTAGKTAADYVTTGARRLETIGLASYGAHGATALGQALYDTYERALADPAAIRRASELIEQRKQDIARWNSQRATFLRQLSRNSEPVPDATTGAQP